MSDEKKEVTVQQTHEPIELIEGEINAKSLQQLNRACQYLAKSGMLPKHFDTPEKVAIGILMCKELGLKSIISLRNIAIINGMPTIWGELPLAIVRNKGKLKYIKEYLLDKNYNEICIENKNIDAEIFVAVCEIQREGGELKKYTYSKADTEKNPNARDTRLPFWTSYRSIMMKRKARGLALKDEFGDLLCGMPIAEYDYDIIPGESKTISNLSAKEKATEKAAFLNQSLSSKITDEEIILPPQLD